MLFECHITSDADKEHTEWLEDAAREYHWKTSEIARDPVLGQATYYYLTSHSDDYIQLYNKMKATCSYLFAMGVPVYREKIELIMYDTKVKV